MTGLAQQVARTIDRHGMLPRGSRVGVAVSGGADSVCLLLLLAGLAPERDLTLHVLHLDHGLRGEVSRQDAAFVRELAGQMGLSFLLREVQIGFVPGNREEVGRRARLDFFREVIASGEVDRVAVGHTRSDQAETVLFRFLRGSGTAGLAGIRPVVAPGIVRPLLDVDRETVRRFLRDRSIPWREDATNRSPAFARNRIRLDLLPQLAREWNPAIEERLAQTADWAAAEEAYWRAEVARLSRSHLTEQGGAVLMRVDVLPSLPLAAARRLVRQAIERVRGDLRRVDFSHVSAVLDLTTGLEGHGRAVLPGVEVSRSFDWLRFVQPGHTPPAAGFSIPAPVPGRVRIPGTGSLLSLELVEKTETSTLSEYVYNGGVGCLDWGSLSGSLHLRNWRAGDQYQPAGSRRPEKIKTLFQQARIPSWERRNWPILIDGASIVWVRRFGPAASRAAGAGTTKILQVMETTESMGEFGIGISQGSV